MEIEIDQSGKIEETSQDTIIAGFGRVGYSLKITAKTKRRIQESFREIGEPKVFVLYTFSILLYLLIKNFPENGHFLVDSEYLNKERFVLNLLERVFLETGHGIPPVINFGLIGKSSWAHNLAIRTFKNQVEPTLVLSFDNLYAELFSIKNERPMLKYQV